jgi:predicted metal-dependent hydrolase
VKLYLTWLKSLIVLVQIVTSEVIVDKDSVEVRAPFNKPDHEIQKVVRNKANWIFRKQREYREMNPQIARPTFDENSTLPYLGKNYPLKTLTQEKNSISFIDGQFLVTLFPSRSRNSVGSYIEGLYEQWLKKIAKPIFINKV